MKTVVDQDSPQPEGADSSALPAVAGSATDAIHSLLEAERAAESALAAAEGEARELASLARRRASELLARTDAAIREQHTAQAARTEAAIAQLRREHETRILEAQRALHDGERLEVAAERVADWLLEAQEPPGEPT